MSEGDMFTKDIPGSSSLEDIDSFLRMEEARVPSEFIDNCIPDGSSDNVAKLKARGPGDLPYELELLEESAPAPGGRDAFWSGDMMVEGVKKAIAAYRKD